MPEISAKNMRGLNPLLQIGLRCNRLVSLTIVGLDVGCDWLAVVTTEE